MIGKIKKVPLREIWKNEARDFTTWLKENIDTLNEALGTRVVITEREKSVGPFNSDLVGEDENGTIVIIENQLEKTDHDHLGKMVTYLSNLENAKTAIWISSAPREEHRKAVDWLNEFTPDDVCFYLIQVEAIQIGGSDPAPLFTTIAEPTEIAKEIGKEKKEYAERHYLRKEFWTALLERANQKTKMYENVSPSVYSWIGTGAGRSGVGYNLAILYGYGQSEIYLDRGKEYPDLNKERFDQLYKHKDVIEKELNQKINWERLDKKRACRISVRFDNAGLGDKEKWPEIQEKMIDTIIKMKKVFDPYIRNLK